MNDRKTFFLGWQARESRAWYPVGRLDASADRNQFTFSYTQGAKSAHTQDNFAPLLDFPSFEKEYTSEQLFPLFQNRIMTSGRHDFRNYLKMLDLDQETNLDPLEILAVDGGYRATDSFQVFPKIQKGENGSFTSRFFLHGWRHTNADAQKRLGSLVKNEQLLVAAELNNPETGLAIQIQSQDYSMLGWAPRYLVNDLAQAMANSPGALKAKVVRINPVPAPSKQRVLVELCGVWPRDYTPMSSKEFTPFLH